MYLLMYVIKTFTFSFLLKKRPMLDFMPFFFWDELTFSLPLVEDDVKIIFIESAPLNSRTDS